MQIFNQTLIIFLQIALDKSTAKNYNPHIDFQVLILIGTAQENLSKSALGKSSENLIPISWWEDESNSADVPALSSCKVGTRRFLRRYRFTCLLVEGESTRRYDW